ncbi:hypothetical protein OBO34_21160 [Clostridiales Family XIII bacterium ASD5510]|uniref:Uncharacterized protein n=1 Tax=Hominibacterium faecale TaxID=2839743 RepID=A0A9J6QZ66_9FIRM|nr:hypothetical protein [Hominibacterium faecale]MCU7380827.1 hypothetical protein [Hominibacterium faecale]
MKARIYRDPPRGILFVGPDRDGNYHIYRKSEASRTAERVHGYGPYSPFERAQQTLDILAHDKHLEELEFI